MQRCIENPDSINFVPPTDDLTRFQYLKDMVLLMMCDGNIDKNEFVLCKFTAETLGFKHKVIDAMVLDIINDFKSKMTK